MNSFLLRKTELKGKTMRTQIIGGYAKQESVGNMIGCLKEVVRGNNDSGVLSLESIKLLVLPVAQRNALSSISLFGSYARDEAGPESDVDLLIDGGNYRGLFGFMDLKEQFEKALGKKVDLISKASLEENKSESGLLFKRNVYSEEKKIYEEVRDHKNTN